MLKRIRVTYHFAPGEEVDRATVERVLGFHTERCPVARSIGGSIDITTELQYADGAR